MNTVVRNIIAIVAGIILGSTVNMLIISLSGLVIPPPAGVDVTDAESLGSSIHLFEPKHFIFPFLAHALGTLVGSFIGALIAAKHRMKVALGVSAFFLLGGVISSFMIPALIWFIVVDVAGAYLPMGFFAGKLAVSMIGKSNNDQ